MSVSERLSKWWYAPIPGSPEMRSCIFGGLGDRKQGYLDFLADKMADLGFHVGEKIEVKGLEIIRARLINQINQSDLVFKHSTKKLCIGVRAISKEGDLRVGFAEMYSTMATFWISVVAFFLLGVVTTIFSAYIMGHGSTDLSGSPPSTAIILVVITLTVSIVPLFLFLAIPVLVWRQKIKTLIVETANFLGSKQVTSFEMATVDLEPMQASRSQRFAKAFFVIGTIIAVVLIIWALLL